MQKDFHFFLIHAILKDAGYKKEDIDIIAYASQYVDDCNENQIVKDNGNTEHIFNHLVHVGKQTYRSVITQTFSLDTLNDQVQNYVLIPFHFLPGNNPAIKNKDSETNCYATRPANESQIADHLFDEVLQSEDKYRLGIMLHTIADTFSHQNFTGIQEDWNSVYPWYSPYSVAPNIGHAEVSQNPDTISDTWKDRRFPGNQQKVDNRIRTMQAVEYIFKKLYAHKNPGKDTHAAWNNLMDTYHQLIYGPTNNGNYDYDERKSAIKKYVNNNKLKYDRKKWLNEAVQYNEDEKQFDSKPGVNFVKSNYWQFQLAAQRQVASVWNDLSQYAL